MTTLSAAQLLVIGSRLQLPDIREPKDSIVHAATCVRENGYNLAPRNPATRCAGVSTDSHSSEMSEGKASLETV